MSALRRLRTACADVWERSGTLTVSQVIENHYKLSPETEGDPGSYDLENNPYWRKVIDCCDDPEVRKVTVKKSTQVGGTILTHGIMMALAVISGSPGMYVLPTRDEYRIQRNRLYGNALVSDDILRKLVPPKSKWSMEVMRLGRMNINAAWAGSEQRLRGKPCRYVFKGETDVMRYTGDAGNPHKSADERTKQFFYSLIFDESTPVGDDSYIANEYDKSNCETLMVQCPHCARRQELRFYVQKSGKYKGCGGFGGYRSEPRVINGRKVDGVLLEPEEAKRKAYYICIDGCRIDQELKNHMIKTGVWCPRGQKVEDIKVHGPWPVGVSPETIPVLTGEAKRSREHSGFHIWTVMQNKISIGDIAAAFVVHHNEGKLRDFFQNWLGLRYKVGQRVPKWDIIAKRYTRSYSAGSVPDKCWFLTGAADVQEDLVYWMVCGWAPMRTPYLIGWGEIYKQETNEESESGEGILLASDLKMLIPALMLPRWNVLGVNPRGKTKLPVRMAGADSNYRSHEVHDLVRSFQPEKNPDKKRLICLRGDTLPAGQLFRKSLIEKNSRTGKPYEGGMTQWQLNRNAYQDRIAERLTAAPNQDGALHLPSDIMPGGKRVLRQLANLRKDDKGLYQIIDGTVGKDYRDLFGYNEAVADMIVGKAGWTEKAWRDEERGRQQSLQKAIESAASRSSHSFSHPDPYE